MMISVLGFGSLWSKRISRVEGTADAAYYNTTGVVVDGRIRNRPCIYGVARFNGNSGFRPDWTERMISKVFDCEPPCIWNGHKKVLFKRLLTTPEPPDAYLVTFTAEQTGAIDTRGTSPWSHSEVQVISFSECRERQEVMLVMPAYAWIRGRLGTFFLEPRPPKPWLARLVLSPGR
jgi:hypothetical protein